MRSLAREAALYRGLRNGELGSPSELFRFMQRIVATGPGGETGRLNPKRCVEIFYQGQGLGGFDIAPQYTFTVPKNASMVWLTAGGAGGSGGAGHTGATATNKTGGGGGGSGTMVS